MLNDHLYSWKGSSRDINLFIQFFIITTLNVRASRGFTLLLTSLALKQLLLSVKKRKKGVMTEKLRASPRC